jgi:uncharacterized protein (TIGR03437 family)
MAAGERDVAVANSGDNSVSILRVNNSAPEGWTPVITVRPIQKLEGIPSPYAVAPCPAVGPPFLVTSPSDNSVRALLGDSRTSTYVVSGSVQVGREPRAIACFADIRTNKLTAAVSNVGDNSLTILDVATFKVTGTIPNVPGSRGFHGIGVFRGANGNVAWVASADANVVTLVDLVSFSVLTQLPVSRPTAVLGIGSSVAVASAGTSQILYYMDAQDYLNNLQAKPYQNVPNPQDAVVSPLGFFAVIGGQDSLWQGITGNLLGGGEISAKTIPGIPGPAALATIHVPSPAPNPVTHSGVNGAYYNVVLVTSTNTNSVFVIQAQPPGPSDFRISSAVQSTFQVAPGQLASAYASAGVSQIAKAASAPLPISLGGVSLSVGGKLSFNTTSGWNYDATGALQAPLLFAGPTQVNLQIPPGISPGAAIAAQLTKPDGKILLTTFNVETATPGIFSLLQNGRGQGAVLNPDYSQNGDPATIAGAKPAARGSVIQIYATGAGATIPALAAGEAAPASGNPLVFTQVKPTVTIGGKAAEVQFSGMAPGYVGLWQINARIPDDVTPGNAVPLSITADGATSNTVTIAVQ